MNEIVNGLKKLKDAIENFIDNVDMDDADKMLSEKRKEKKAEKKAEEKDGE